MFKSKKIKSKNERMMSKVIEIEFYCLPCDSEKVVSVETFRKIKEIQEKFDDEWKSEDICFDCARRHQISLGDYYTEEECVEQENEFRKRGMIDDGKRWIAKGGGVVVSYRVMNKLKKAKKM